MSDFEKRIFENPSAMSAYSRVKDGLFESFEGFKSTYGSSVISATYEAFKGALSVPESVSYTHLDVYKRQPLDSS